MRSVSPVRLANLVFCGLLLLSLSCLAQSPATISLPAPQTTGGLPLMQALQKRHTTRAFADQPLTSQQLSNLLWAAFGVNRPPNLKLGLGRTAPSAMNKQEIELRVLLALYAQSVGFPPR